MLKKAVVTLLRTLNCSSGQVLQAVPAPAADTNSGAAPTIFWAPVCTLPRSLLHNAKHSTFIERLLPKNETEWKQWALGLPMRASDGMGQWLVFNLPDFGVLVLEKMTEPFEKSFSLSIQVLMDKLASAAHACLYEQALRNSRDIAEANEKRLNWAVDTISAALIQVASGSLDTHIDRDYKGDQIDTMFFLVDTTISELRHLVNENERRNAEIQARLEALVEERTAQLREQTRILEQMAITDPLTQAYNRRQFYKMAELEMERIKRNNQPLSAMVMDLDHFKQVNDKYGHHVGDQVLIKFAKICQGIMRNTDVFARYGGEEFVALLPNADLQAAKEVAERIRRMVETVQIDSAEFKVLFTVSIGVSTLENSANLAFDSLLTQADQALYVSKKTGRNRVTHWAEIQAPSQAEAGTPAGPQACLGKSVE